MTTLTLGATTLDLPDDLLWEDEFDWQPVEYVPRYSVTGALLLNFGTRQTGRPITLSGSPQHAWVQRAAVLQLQAWSYLPAPDLVLVHRGATTPVTWSPRAAPLAATPIVDFANPTSTDHYFVVLRLITRT